MANANPDTSLMNEGTIDSSGSSSQQGEPSQQEVASSPDDATPEKDPCVSETEKLLNTLKELTNEKTYNSAEFLRDHSDPSKVNKLLKNLIQALKKEQPRLKAGNIKAPKWKLFRVVTGRTFGADDQILQKINADLCEEPGQCDMVMVFCPICTRAAADAAEAMKRVPGEAEGRPVILVMMQHTRNQEHPNPSASWSHEQDNIKLTVGVLYHQAEGGLLECSVNNESLQKIKNLDFQENKSNEAQKRQPSNKKWLSFLTKNKQKTTQTHSMED